MISIVLLSVMLLHPLIVDCVLMLLQIQLQHVQDFKQALTKTMRAFFLFKQRSVITLWEIKPRKLFQF